MTCTEHFYVNGTCLTCNVPQPAPETPALASREPGTLAEVLSDAFPPLADVLTDEALAAEFGSVKISPPGLRARVISLVGTHEQSLRAEIDRLQAEAQEFSDRPCVACEDCGLAYDRFPLDVVLSDAQWLAIHPERDGNGQLCGQCIVERGKRVLNPIIAVLRFVINAEHGHFSQLKNVWSFTSYAALQRRVQELEQERDEYRTLAGIGKWHDDCRPNRHMAARELAKSQEIINRLADTIAERERQLAAAEGRAQEAESKLNEIQAVLMSRAASSEREATSRHAPETPEQ